jgi:thioredoxin-related protein
MRFLPNKSASIFQALTLITILVFSSCTSKSQQKSEKPAVVNTSAIAWNKSISDALAQAKAQNKMLFVECFTPTCPICMSMEPIFKKPEVIKKYNTDFINYKLDVGVAEQVKFLDANKIRLASFPQFLYFSPDGKLVHQADVIADPASFITAANNAQNTTTRADTYKARFDAGERGLDFLVNLAAFARLKTDTLSSWQAADEIYKIFPKDQLSSENSWKITKKCITDLDNGFAKHWFDNVKIASAFEAKDGHGGNEFNILGQIIQTGLYGSKGKTFSSAKIQEVKRYMGLANAGQYADVATWELETRALIREGKTAQGLEVADKTFQKFLQNPLSLNYLVKVVNDIYPDQTHASMMEKWLKSIKAVAKDPAVQADYLYEAARFNLKMGDKIKAKDFATQGRTSAATAKADLSKFNDLLSKI